MSAKEFRGWLEYSREEPLETTEIQLAAIATMVNNGLGGKERVKSFYPGNRGAAEEVKLTPQQMNTYLKGMF